MSPPGNYQGYCFLIPLGLCKVTLTRLGLAPHLSVSASPYGDFLSATGLVKGPILNPLSCIPCKDLQIILRLATVPTTWLFIQAYSETRSIFKSSAGADDRPCRALLNRQCAISPCVPTLTLV